MQIPNQYGVKEDDTPITKDEFRKIERAMKKPEFQELLSDYMLEISDPKNKDEYDEYLRQMQREKELPKGLTLIKPDPQFCIKTTLWAKANKKYEQKFFINICSSAVVEAPFAEDVVQNGQKGKNWKIPFTIGKIRYDQDKKNTICNTVDIAYHPLAIGYSNKFPGYQSILCSTAIDAAQKQLGERNEEISNDYKVLKNTKCKGKEPALLTVRLDKKGKINSQLESRQGGLNNAQTNLQKDLINQQNEYKQQKQQQKQQQQQQNENNLQEIDKDDEVPKESTEIESESISQPKYKFIYSFPVEYSDFLDLRSEYIQKRPTQLSCEVKLPKINSVQQVQIQLSDTMLILDAPQKYYLNLNLPYPIISDQGKAKFDTKSKILKLTAQIDPQYLKEKALQDISRSKAQFEQFNEDPEVEQPISNNIDSSINFIPESNEPENLIQEIRSEQMNGNINDQNCEKNQSNQLEQDEEIQQIQGL